MEMPASLACSITSRAVILYLLFHQR